MLSDDLAKISIPSCITTRVLSFLKAQKLLDDFKKKAYPKSEQQRIKLAQEMCALWRSKDLTLSVPAVVSRADMWYLVQLFSQNRHVHQDKSFYSFDISREEEVILENFPESDWVDNRSLYASPLSLLGLIYQKASIGKQTRILSRNSIDTLLKQYGEAVLIDCKIDPDKYKLSLIPFDFYLRLQQPLKLGNHILNTHFDGYRLRSDGQLTGLYGGDRRFGGVSFIDSFWNDIINQSIVVRLAIIRKNYGY